MERVLLLLLPVLGGFTELCFFVARFPTSYLYVSVIGC